MEFKRLADVEVVETATDTDKVLIEQNGEIKRVPKTEVGGGGGGNMLIITSNEDGSVCTANMTLTEAVEAFNKRELSGAALYFTQDGMTGLLCCMLSDYSPMVGFEFMIIYCDTMDVNLFWTADGISPEPPEPPEGLS